MAISPESKMRTPDRVLVLKVIDGEKPKNSTGQVDPRLFKGENKLHAVMDQQTTLWRLKYDDGNIPQALKGQFTNFKALKAFAENYFKTRNIEIVEVKDVT
jgi:hypothetical protein